MKHPYLPAAALRGVMLIYIVPFLGECVMAQTQGVSQVEGVTDATQGNSIQLSVEKGNSEIALEWNSTIGKRYQLLFTPDLGTTPWFALGAPIQATAVRTLFQDGTPLQRPMRFYRVMEVPGQSVLFTPDSRQNNVAVTREFLIGFENPLSDKAVVDETALFAESGGQRLATRIIVSRDRRSIALQFIAPLPPQATIRVTIRGNILLDRNGIALDVDSDGLAGGEVTVEFRTAEALAEVLLVDDDGGASFEKVYEQIVLRAARTSRTWNTRLTGTPPYRVLQSYSTVIWITGDQQFPAVRLEDKQNLAAYLEGGGSLLLISPGLLAGNYQTEIDIPTGRFRVDEFASKRLGIRQPLPPEHPSRLQTAPTSPIAGAFTVGLNNSLPTSDPKKPFFLLELAEPSEPFLIVETGQLPRSAAALARDMSGVFPHRLIYWTFDLADVNPTMSVPVQIDERLLTTCLDWLENGPDILWSDPLDGQNDFPLNGVVHLRFRRGLAPETIPGNIKLETSTGSQIPFNWVYFAENRILQITPASLSANTSLLLRVYTNVLDIYGQNIAQSAVLRFETGSAPDRISPLPPPAPLIQQDGTGDGQISLLIGSPADTGFRVYRRGDNAGSFLLLHSGIVLGTTFIDDSCETGKGYEYAITSVDSALNESSLSPPVVGFSPDKQAPRLTVSQPAISPGRRTRTSSQSLAVAGGIDDTNAIVTVAGALVPVVNGFWVRQSTPLTSEGEQVIEVIGTDLSGNRSSQSLFVIRDTRVEAPFGVRVAPMAPGTNRVEWVQSGETDLVQYEVFRQEAANGLPASLGSVNFPQTFFIDPTASPEKAYCYFVRASDDLGNRSARSELVCPLRFGALFPGGISDGGSFSSTGNRDSTVAPTLLTPVVPVQENNGAARVRYIAEPGARVGSVQSASFSEGYFPNAVELHDGDVFYLNHFIIENPSGFGPTLTVNVGIPDGFSFDRSGLMNQQLTSVSLWGTYPSLGTAGNPGQAAWDDSIYGIRDDEGANPVTLISATESNLVLNITGGQIFIGSNPQGMPIKSGPPNIKAIMFRINPPITVTNLAHVTSRAPRVAVTVNGSQFEATLCMVLDPDPFARKSLIRPLDEYGGKLNILTGDYSFDVPLFIGSGHGLNLEGWLSYSSLNASWSRAALEQSKSGMFDRSPLGPGWAYPYGMRILEPRVVTVAWGVNRRLLTNELHLVCPGGRVTTWTDLGSGRFTGYGGGFVSSPPAIVHHSRSSWGWFRFPNILREPGGYVLKEEDQGSDGFTELHFDMEGRLSRIDPHGGAPSLTITYNGSIQTVTDSSGRQAHFHHDAAGKITRIQDPAGGDWRLEYSSGALTKITEEGTGYGWEFAYDNADYFLKERKLPHGFVIQSDYETGWNSDNRFFWGALRSTQWKDSPGESRRQISYQRGVNIGTPFPDAVVITTPSGRNALHHELPDIASLIRSTGSPSLAQVVIKDEVEGNPGSLRKIADEVSDNPYFLDSVTNVLGDRRSLTHQGPHLTAIRREDDALYTWERNIAFTTLQNVRRENGWRTNVERQYRYAEGRSRQERLTEIFLPGSTNSIKIEYDAEFRLVSTTDLDGDITRLIYHGVPGKRGLVNLYKPCAGQPFPGTSTDPDPFKWELDYDGLGRITSVSDPDKNITRYSYDTAGRLVQVLGPTNVSGSLEAPITIFEYDGDLLTKVAAKVSSTQSQVTRYVYDDRGRLIEQHEPGTLETGAPIKWIYRYDPDGNQTNVFEVNGAIIRHTYDNRGNLLRTEQPATATVEYEYDTLDRVREVRRTDASNVRVWTVLAFDKLSRPLELALPVITQGGVTGRPRILTEYDAHDNITSEVYSFGGATLRLQRRYNVLDEQFREITEMGAGQEVWKDTVYDVQGRVTQAQGPRLGTRTFGPNASIQPQSNRTAPVVSNYRYNCFDQVDLVTDFNRDERMRASFDIRGLMQSVSVPNPAVTQSVGAAQANTLAFGFQLDERGLPQTISDVFGSNTQISYDALGREQTIRDPGGTEWITTYSPSDDLSSASISEGSAGSDASQAEYDPLGNPTHMNAPGDDGAGTSFEYDSVGRLLSEEDPVGRKLSSTYNGFGEVISETFASGARIEYERDGLGRVTRLREISTTGARIRVEVTEYDLLGRVSAVEDESFRIEYQLDNLGRTTRKTTRYKAENFAQSLAYDYGEYGNLVAMEDDQGYRTEYTWDNENNLQSIRVVTPEGNEQQVQFRHDRAGKLSGWDLRNNSNQVAVNATISRDQKGRLTALAYQGASSNLPKVEYEYDARDLRTKASYPSKNLIVNYGYDRRGYLSSETWTDNGGNLVSEDLILYDSAGNRTRREKDGRVTRYEVDRAFRLIGEQREDLVRIPRDQITTSADSEFSANYSHRLANDGLNPDAIGPGAGWRSQTNQVTHWIELQLKAARPVAALELSVPASRHGLEEFWLESWNPSLNAYVRIDAQFVLHGARRSTFSLTTRERSVRVTFTVPKLTSRLKVVIPVGGTGQDPVTNEQLPDVFINEICLFQTLSQSISRQYDLDGRMISDGTFTFGHDIRGRLTRVTGPGVDKSWLITPEGLRGAETDHLTGTTTYFANNGANVYLEFARKPNGIQPVLRHVHALEADAPLGFFEYDDSGQRHFRWVLQDGSANATHVLDETGHTLDERLLNAWGEDVIAPTRTTSNPYGFAGAREDRDTGLIYNRARMLDPNTGRFTGPDPSGMINGPNLYAYAANNPTMFRDPDGQFLQILIGAALGAGVDIGVQLLTKGTVDDWTSVLISGAAGAASGGLSIVAKAGQIAKNGRVIVGLAGRTFQVSQNIQKAAHGTLALETAVGGYHGLQAVRQGVETGDPRSIALGIVGLWGMKSAAMRRQLCFLEGTLVETKEGLKPIENVQVGDLVLSRNADSDCDDYQPVIRLYRSTTQQTCNLTVVRIPNEGTEKGNERASKQPGFNPPALSELQTIRCTPDHPFFKRGTGWAAASTLVPGDQLLGAGRSLLSVIESRVLAQPAATLNLEVHDWHTYFVAEHEGSTPLWAHNICDAELARLAKQIGGLNSRATLAIAVARRNGVEHFIISSSAGKPTVAQRALARHLLRPHGRVYVVPGDKDFIPGHLGMNPINRKKTFSNPNGQPIDARAVRQELGIHYANDHHAEPRALEFARRRLPGSTVERVAVNTSYYCDHCRIRLMLEGVSAIDSH